MNTHRFVAFSTIDGAPLAYAASTDEAIRLASRHLPNADFVEVLDCGDAGSCIVSGFVPLATARQSYATAFRGTGYDN